MKYYLDSTTGAIYTPTGRRGAMDCTAEYIRARRHGRGWAVSTTWLSDQSVFANLRYQKSHEFSRTGVAEIRRYRAKL